MNDESTESVAKRRLSRRTALKTGAAVGVGVAAWSGATVTSLGGTPAYAAGCTGVINVDIAGGCRNTDQGTPCPGAVNSFRYHTLTPTLPSGFTLTNNVPEGTCCNVNWTPVLSFPSGLTCTVTLLFGDPSQCSKVLETHQYTGTSPLPFTLVCSGTLHSQTGYTVSAKCATTGAPPGCLT